MKIINAFLSLLLLTFVSANYKIDQYTPVSLYEKNRVVSLFNKERTKVGLGRVQWNNTCTSVLENIADKYSKDWFFEKINKTRLPGLVQENAFNIEFLDEFPEFNSTCPGWIFFDRDTYKNNIDPISKIFLFRQRQASCCNLNNCSNTIFTNYQTCCRSTKTGHCAWAFHYYPRRYIRNLDQITGLILNRRGPFTPNPQKQKYVYFLYGRYSHGSTDKVGV